MKNILFIFTVILSIGVFSTLVLAGSNTLPDSKDERPKVKTMTIQQLPKQVKPPAKPQKPTRTEVRPVLKSSEPFKPLPAEDRKKINDSTQPVN